MMIIYLCECVVFVYFWLLIKMNEWNKIDMQLTNANLEIMRWFREIERDIISFTHIEISKGFWVLQGMNFPFDLYEIREDVQTLFIPRKRKIQRDRHKITDTAHTHNVSLKKSQK